MCSPKVRAFRPIHTPSASGSADVAAGLGLRRAAILLLALYLLPVATARLRHLSPVAAAQATGEAGPTGPGAPFSADKLTELLPPSVYFQGRTAPLQLRNAAGTDLGSGQIVWSSLVDSSGYSTSVQEKYQFYLVSEGPLQFGSARLPAGAYGGGFLGERFLLMDLGGHTIAQGALETDATLRRPRPLQMVVDHPGAVRLYLGRHWVLLQKDNAVNAR